MARRPQAVHAEVETVQPPEFTLAEARALELAMRHGLIAIEGHGLVANTGLIRAAIEKFRGVLPAR